MRARLWFERILTIVAAAALLAAIAYVCSPLRENPSAYGGHDWDVSSAFRYLVVKSLKTYGQFPFWNPYIGGGYTSWGYVESATIVVSPLLPVYLLFDLRTALRLEVVICAVLAVSGTWLFAGRFTKSAAARAFACVVFALNGRWAMQAAMGHTWHLYFAWLPWALYFLDRAPGWSDRESGRYRFACAAGAFVALTIYNGAHYPMIHLLVIMGLYALLRAASARSWQPLFSATLAVIVGVGLAAPKLIPMIDGVSKAPRLVESNEWMDLGVFLHALIAPSQRSGATIVRVSQWGWHEWGSYIGWPALLLLVFGIVRAQGPRAHAWKWVAAILLLLSFGNFHEYSPWNQLHRLPIFDSLHVPSRWLYSALLILSVLSAQALESLLSNWKRWRVALELGLCALVAIITVDVARVAHTQFQHSFWMQLDPRTQEETLKFHQEFKTPPGIDYNSRDWGIPTLPAVIASVGLIENTTIGGFNVYVADPSGKVKGVGAIGRDQPGYRGEVFTESGTGTAEIASFSPNELVVRLHGAKPGDVVVVNQNYDPGWKASGRAVRANKDRIAFTVEKGEETVTLRYRPRMWVPGLLVFSATIAALASAYWVSRRRRVQAPATD